jgi:hypothetical protein
MTQAAEPKLKRAIVAAVQLPGVSDLEFDASLEELRQLAKTLGFDVVDRFTQKRARFDSAAYFGVGKREELRSLQREHRRDSRRPRDLPFAGPQPRKGSRPRGHGPDHGHPRDLSPARTLPRRARAGRDRAPRVHGAARCAKRPSRPARRTAGAAAPAAAAAASRLASSTGARSAIASQSCRASSTRSISIAGPSAPGARNARGSRAWRWSDIRMRASPR